MKRYLTVLWPVFLLDLFVYILLELWHSRATESSWAPVILGYVAAPLAGYLAGRAFGRVMAGVIGVLILWLLWRPMLFVVNVALSLAIGTMAVDGISILLIGVAGGLLFSAPIAIALATIAAMIGRRNTGANADKGST